MIEIFFTFWSASSHSTRSGVMGAVVMVTRARTAGDQEMCAGREPDNNCGGGVLGGGGAVATAECCLMSVGTTVGTTLGTTLHCSALLLATGTLGHIMGPHRGTSGVQLTMGKLDMIKI